LSRSERRLRLRSGAAPVDGAANSRLIVVLAKALDVERSPLKIARGESSRDKEVLIVGGASDALATLRILLGSVEKA
jgi:uncharacterized protein YggU (UPF0235/DUF167 family)